MIDAHSTLNLRRSYVVFQGLIMDANFKTSEATYERVILNEFYKGEFSFLSEGRYVDKFITDVKSFFLVNDGSI